MDTKNLSSGAPSGPSHLWRQFLDLHAMPMATALFAVLGLLLRVGFSLSELLAFGAVVLTVLPLGLGVLWVLRHS